MYVSYVCSHCIFTSHSHMCVQAIDRCAVVTRKSYITSKLYPTKLRISTQRIVASNCTHIGTPMTTCGEITYKLNQERQNIQHIPIYCTHRHVPCTPHVMYTPYTLISFSHAWTPLWKDFSISCRSRNLWRSSSNLLSTVCKGWTIQYRQWSHSIYAHYLSTVSWGIQEQTGTVLYCIITIMQI